MQKKLSPLPVALECEVMTDFDALARTHRAELHAHCYRMLGSLADAEDVVQEAFLRAGNGVAGFENRASLRTWLFRVTTNACIDALAKRPPRALPQHKFAAADPTEPFGAPLPPSEFVDPYPGAPWGLPVGGRGDANVVARESVGLAFVAALQHLPPLQRAVLLLRDVLELSCGG